VKLFNDRARQTTMPVTSDRVNREVATRATKNGPGFVGRLLSDSSLKFIFCVEHKESDGLAQGLLNRGTGKQFGADDAEREMFIELPTRVG